MFAITRASLIRRLTDYPGISYRIFAPFLKRFSTQAGEDDKPLEYSKSAASHWKAEYSRIGALPPTRLWYEPYVILASLSVFLVYFGILREENGTDEELHKSLNSRISGMEEHQLRLSLQYNLQNGLPTEDIVKRLKELKLEESQ